MKYYQLDTGYACGGIGVFNGRIVSDGTAPIFRNLVGQELSIILSRGKRYKINDITNN
jgi:hypothetical protein